MKPRDYWEQSSQWLARTITIVLLMVAPGYVGSLLDRQWHSRVFTPLGFLLGIAFAVAALLVFIKTVSPPPQRDTPKRAENKPPKDDQLHK
ncbi:MAG: AtpZ/AtpI family protein [Planctomycetales bacterium]|nr:AtpZ/AtpI family protein [Planctomycetales bacterium]